MFECNAAFGMSHRNVEFINAFQEHAVARRDLQANPTVGVATIGIPGQRDLIFQRFLGRVLDSSTHQQASFQDRLKPVADPQHQFVGLQEFPHGIVELST